MSNMLAMMGKEYFAKLHQISGAGAGFFWPLVARVARKKIPGALSESRSSLGKKIRSRSPSCLKKKVRSR